MQNRKALVFSPDTETITNRRPNRSRPKVAPLIVAAALLGASGSASPAPNNSSERALSGAMSRQAGAEITQNSVNEELSRRNEFLRVNEAQKQADVKTDSGMTIHFYTPGPNISKVPIDVDPAAVNNINNFVISSLSLFNQDYMPQEDIARIQQTAAKGGFENVDMTVLLCFDEYRRPNISDDATKVATASCTGYGEIMGESAGERALGAKYYPFLIVGPTFRAKSEPVDVNLFMEKIPPAVVPNSSTYKQRYLDRDQTMTAFFTHELAHFWVSPAKGAPDDQDKEHNAIVTPLGYLTESLMSKSSWVRNPTQYSVEVAFGVSHDPLGSERDRIIAEKGGYLYAMPEV